MPLTFDQYGQDTTEARFEEWLGTSYTSEDLSDDEIETFDIDATYETFVGSDLADTTGVATGLTVRQCWIRHQLASGAAHVVLGSAEHPDEFGDLPDAQMMPSLTLLRWISRPAWYGARALGLAAGAHTALVLQVTVDDEGRALLRRYRESDLPVAEQLLLLGVDDVRAVHGDLAEVSVDQAVLASVLVFAVAPRRDGLDTGFTVTPPPKPAAGDLPADIYSSLFIGLADDRHGAPLEAVWHLVWETTGVVWCLLNEGREIEQVSRIPYRQTMSSSDFVEAIAACNRAGLRGASLPVFVAIEESAGHCIYIDEVTDDHVVYLDPWPGRSLLARGNNTLDVSAERVDDTWKRWRVTRTELERVAYACLVRADVWCGVCGVTSTVAFSELEASQLFTFFHLTQAARVAIDGGVRVEVTPGNWKESIEISFDVSPAGDLRHAVLTVDRAWLVAPETRPFAFDLVKSFVAGTVSPVDSQEATWFVEAVWSVLRGELEEKLSSGPAHLIAQVRAGVMAVMGATPYGRVVLPRTTIRITNDDPDPTSGHLRLAVSDPVGDGGSLLEDLETGYRMDEYRLYYAAKLEHEVSRRRPADSDQPS